MAPALIKAVPTAIPDVLIFEPQVFGDERGFLLVSWNADNFRDATGSDVTFVQDNHSRSRRGVLRGLHYQIRRPQGKLVRVVTGRVFDVAVDVRRPSPTFGRWAGVELSADNHRMLWVPPGFAHGFLVLSDTANFLYKTTSMRPNTSAPWRGTTRRSGSRGRWRESRCCRRRTSAGRRWGRRRCLREKASRIASRAETCAYAWGDYDSAF